MAAPAPAPCHDAARAAAHPPIAIIGMSGVFPDADDVDAFWANLRSGRDSVGEAPRDRGWDIDDHYDPAPQTPGKSYARNGGFLKGVEAFDSLFFEVPPKDAEKMDPSARLFIQEAWRAVEDAGYAPGSLGPGACGMFYCAKGDYDVLVRDQDPTHVSPTDSFVPGILAYRMNMQGPAVSVDTACSSTLSAVAMACDALALGNCDVAIAGGGGINTTVNTFVTLSQLTLFSPSGRCFTFDARADGTVVGEAVAAIVLKPLARALADGDHIYGVLVGWGVNQDGRTNGLTAPSARSQARLQTEVYRRFGIDPAVIGMIEAHGTGTKLGDPIEVRALQESFRGFTDRAGYCALGSLKSNIGHAFFGAGIASVVKVVQSLRHREIPPTINFERLNPAIRLDGSPFYVNTELRPWTADDGQPRCAAINALGASGVNAHVVIQEAPPRTARPAARVDGPCAVVLSARAEDRLQAYAERLRAWCATPAAAEADLSDVAFTLQTGREAMTHRIAVLADDLGQLAQRLDSYLAGAPEPCVFQGRLSPSATQRVKTAEALAERAEAAAAAADAAALAALWTEGAEVDWVCLYPSHDERRPRRVPLPTYPFAAERVWLDVDPRAEATAALHPLLHANTSNLREHGFASRFTGEEFFLRDHRIQGEKVLPGVAYLEMARAAIEHALAGQGGGPVGLRLENVVWMQPFVLQPADPTLRIAVAPAANANPEDPARLEFEIYGGDPEAEAVVRYCQGEAVRLDAPIPPALDLDAIRVRCRGRDVAGADLYPALQAAGFGLGPGQQGVVTLHRGEGEALGRLAVPAAACGAFVLHPSILDSALHCAAGLATDPAADFPLALPFALEELDVLAPCDGDRWAWVRYSPGSGPADALVRMDIDICDGDGRVCAQLRRFASRPLVKPVAGAQQAAPAQAPAAATANETFLLRPRWSDTALQPQTPGGELPSRHVICCGATAERAANALRRQGVDHVTAIAIDPGEALDAAYGRAAMTVLGVLKGELGALAAKGAAKSRRMVQLTLDAQAVSGGLDGLSALLKTATKENGRLLAQTVQLLDEAPAAQLAECLALEAADPASREVRYLGGQRALLCTEDCGRLGAPAKTQATHPWRDDGLYVITGGAGGLGLVVARDIAARAPGAKVRLVGRSTLDEERRTAIEALRAQGADVIYRVADVLDRAAVERLRDDCLAEHGGVTGVIHAAGVLRDGYIFRKDLAEVADVLAPKVSGLVNLDEVFAADRLDLFVAFSSFAGEFGNPGQSDYACANAFMDSYLRRRAQLARNGGRSGRSVAIGWPLWLEGGMSIDAAYQEMMAKTDGVRPMPTDAGLGAFYRILAGDDAHMLVLHGEERSIQAAIARPVVKPAAPEAGGGGETRRLQRRLLAHVGRRVAELIRVDPSRIEAEAELGEFGLDSISLTQLCNTLNREFELKLSPTIFFEHTTLRAFTEHLAERFGESLARVLDDTELQGGRGARQDGPPKGKLSPRRVRGGYRQAAAQSPRLAAASPPPPVRRDEPIAIIGLSARFPLADDAAGLWRNLLEGRDCIREAPADRWDWRAIWGDPIEEPGRTRVKWGGFMDGIGDFDPAFFSISPREAETMDPQQRLLMMHVWKAIEDAGYAPSSLAGGNTALYIATHDSGYYELFEKAGLPSNGSEIPTSMAPNRMSFFLDLHGASEPVETACSSSLVAIHRGVGALRNRHTDLAIVGGVETICTPTKHINFSRNGLLSEDGRCKTFSAQANGYARAEGVGMLVLKRLTDAERDGDDIRGVVLGTAENHGGRANSLTAPNPRAQAEVLRAAYRDGEVDPRTVGYIEAHGTGTALGDPVEIEGLKSAFRDLYDETRGATTLDRAAGEAHIALGSIKSNIGHTELAAGVAGVIKVLLQMQHRTLVRTLHCETVNPLIDLADTPFRLATETAAWPAPRDRDGRELPRRAGVSSFGAGGVNAHVVLEEYAPA